MENQEIETENFKQLEEAKIISDVISTFVTELSQKNDKTIESLIDFMNRQSEMQQKTIQILAEVIKK